MKTSLASAMLLLSFCSLPMLADGIGTSVTGSAQVPGYTANLFDPSYGLVPSGYGNTNGTTVTIGSGTEFGLSDGVITYAVDLTGNSLTFTNTNNITEETENPITFTFTDPAFNGFTLVSNSADVSYSMTGDQLSFTNPGGTQTGTAVFDYTTSTSVTPEPSSWLLLGTGLVGAVGSMRRRIFA